jgi:hypothetical protein
MHACMLGAMMFSLVAVHCCEHGARDEQAKLYDTRMHDSKRKAGLGMTTMCASNSALQL